MNKKIEIALAICIGSTFGVIAAFACFTIYKNHANSFFVILHKQSDEVAIQAVVTSNKHSQRTNPTPSSHQIKTKAQQVASQLSSSTHLESENVKLIHDLVQSVNKISNKSDYDHIAIASQSYKKLYDYNTKNPKFADQLTQKQKDIITEYSNKLCNFKNLKSIIFSQKISVQKNDIVDIELVQKFIKSVHEIPFGDKKNSEYKEKLEKTAQLFNKYIEEIKNKKILAVDQKYQMKSAMKKLFESITKQQALEYGMNY